MLNKIRIIIFLNLLILYHFTIAQEQEKSIIIHPLIGNKLDAVEEEYFKLFPNISGFQESVFYLNPDSTLRAKIVYVSDGIMKDTVIEKYANLNIISARIERVVRIKMNNDIGSKVRITINENEKVKEQLFSADENYIYTVNPEKLNQHIRAKKNNLITLTPTSSVQKISIERSASGWDYTDYGLKIGAAIGLVGGIIYTATRSGSIYEQYMGEIARVAVTMAGVVIEMGVGLLSGFIIWLIDKEDDVIVDPNLPTGLSELKQYVRYPEPKSD